VGARHSLSNITLSLPGIDGRETSVSATSGLVTTAFALNLCIDEIMGRACGR
jgi:hypothetical protein